MKTMTGETGTRSLDAGNLRVSDVSYPPGATLEPHQHAQAVITLTLHGTISESYEGGRATCDRQQATFKPPGVFHANRVGPNGARCIIVELPDEALDPIRTQTDRFNDVVQFAAPLAWRFGRDLAAEFQTQDGLSTMSIEALVWALLPAMARTELERPAGSADWLPELRRFVETSLDGVPSLPAMADRFGVHPAHAARRFRQVYGQTIGQCSRQARVLEAARMLHGTNWTISEIGVRLGFCDHSHFTRTFKGIVGATPSVFRHQP